jgi:hypothetical protein
VDGDERDFDGRRRDNRGPNEWCLGERALGGAERNSDEVDMSRWCGGDREGEEDEGLNEEEGLSEEDNDEVVTQIADRDPLATGSSSADIKLVSILGSGKGGNGRRGDFENSCNTVVK